MIWNFCIRRPVFTLVIFLVLTIFGLFGYFRMPLRENPDVEFPIVSVNVVLPGAEPEVVETEIVEPLEEQINTVEGLKKLTSTSREQVATVTAEFELWRDVDIAAQDVRDRVNRALRELPDGIESPIIRKIDPDAQAIMWIALTGNERWDGIRLSRYADEVLKPRLESIRGVGQILIGGERRYAVRVRLDPELLAAHQVTVQDVVDTIRANNVDIPSGRIESSGREFLIKTRGQFSSPEPINDLIITSHLDAPVRIRDVGRAVDGVENDRQLARFTGGLTVGLGIIKQSDANTVDVAETVASRVHEISRDFPQGLAYTVATDDSVYIKESIRDLLFTVFFAGGLVILVVLYFLRNAWGTAITGLAIPASLLGGLAFMNLLGFSINTLTMLALILAIGIVIDDAIVVLESSFRHLEEGADPIPASRVGTTEVAFPALANTLSLGAVFIPVAFTAGLIGRFFFEFGLTVAVTVFTSTFTALTLTPMLCSRLLRAGKSRGRIWRWLESTLVVQERFYSWILHKALRHRLLTLILAVAALVLGFFLMTRLSTEFTPTVDRSQFMISFETPEGATLSETDDYARRIEKTLDGIPEVDHYFLAIGLSRGGGPGKVNEGICFVHMIPRSERKRHQSEVVQELRGQLGRIPGGRAYVIQSSGAGVAGGGAPVQLVLQHTDLEALADRQEQVMSWMRQRPEFIGVNSDLKMNKPQVEVSIRRDRASLMGISVSEISNTMRLLLGEPDISEIEEGSERYEVIPEITSRGDMVPSGLLGLYVRTSQGGLVSLDNLVTTTETVGPSAIHHFNRVRAATISASTPPGVALGDALQALQQHLEETLPREFTTSFTGQSQDFQESFRNLMFTIVFSVVFIYLVLSAQFESFLHPLVILLTLPLALVGAFGALWLFNMPFGIVAFIGLIMLMGMATKNAILMVDYSNVLVARGSGIAQAAEQAARIRFRPVLMTTVSTVLGLMPIALGYGAGGEARAPMGVAVTAGLLTTTTLTLLVIPVVYTLVGQGLQKLRSGKTKERTA